jgi:hypothetical protein
MIASALAPLGSSNIAQDEYVEDLRIVIICSWCGEVPPNISEDYSSGDVCTSCDLVLADHIIDTRPELRSSSDNYSPSPDYSLSEYKLAITQTATVQAAITQAVITQTRTIKARNIKAKDIKGTNVKSRSSKSSNIRGRITKEMMALIWSMAAPRRRPQSPILLLHLQ